VRFLTFISFFIILVCNKNEPKPIIYGYEYFPVSQGHYRVYNVVDIFHDEALGAVHDTNYYQFKEVIAESLVDEEEDTIQKIRRYQRENDTLSWEIQEIWTQKRTATTAEVVEENDRMIKMVFAIAYNRNWNGNALNNEDALNCYYENIYEPYDLPVFSFDSTVIVEKENFLSVIDYRRQYEVYARHIGSVKKVFKHLEINNSDTTDVIYGTEIFMELIEFGVE